MDNVKIISGGDYLWVPIPDGWPGSTYNTRRYAAMHHVVYWQHTGIVPTKEQVIHHKDGNKTNNSIDNLELLARAEHSAKHARPLQIVETVCPYCQSIFVARLKGRFQQKFCSRSCGTRYHCNWTYRILRSSVNG